MSHPEVPFSRTIHEGSRGGDVLALKRGLSRAEPTFYPWHDFSNYAGPVLINGLVKFKVKHGLGRSPYISVIGWNVLEQQHAKNKPLEWAFDSLSVKLASDYYTETHDPDKKIREAGVAAAMFWYTHRMATAYSQHRPFPMIKPPQVASQLDCSGLATLCHYAGGAPNPNNRPWDGLGYTGTLVLTGTRVRTIEELKPLDLIFYGHSYGRPGFNAGDPTHVAVFVGMINGIPYVVSNGSYPMRWAPYNYRSDINHFRHYDMGV